jgi:hypothetical protein
MDERTQMMNRKLMALHGEKSNGGVPLNIGLVESIEVARDKLKRMSEEGKPAKEMAEVMRHIAMMTLLDNMAGEDKRLANDAAKEILARSDGKPTGDTQAGNTTNINIMSVAPDELARKLAFLDQLRMRGVPPPASPDAPNAHTSHDIEDIDYDEYDE